jgi:hypothetical protein
MGEPLNEDEKKELGRRRRAAELESMVPVEIRAGGERAELESRRKIVRDLFEMG